MKSLVIEAAPRGALGFAPRVRDKEKASTLGMTIGALSNYGTCTINNSSAFGVREDSTSMAFSYHKPLVSAKRRTAFVRGSAIRVPDKSIARIGPNYGCGAGGGNRTPTRFRAQDFKSRASACFATPACQSNLPVVIHLHIFGAVWALLCPCCALVSMILQDPLATLDSFG